MREPNKTELLEEMFDPYISFYDRFNQVFGCRADITGTQEWEVSRILKKYSNQIDKLVKDAKSKMEEFIEEEHLHHIDGYHEDCEQCQMENQEWEWEERAADYHYRRSV